MSLPGLGGEVHRETSRAMLLLGIGGFAFGYASQLQPLWLAGLVGLIGAAFGYMAFVVHPGADQIVRDWLEREEVRQS